MTNRAVAAAATVGLILGVGSLLGLQPAAARVKPTPKISGFAPGDLGVGASKLPLLITGVDLQPKAAVSIVDTTTGFADGVTVSGPAKSASGGIVVTVSVSPSTPTVDSQTVTVTNPDKTSAAATIAVDPAPSLGASNVHGQNYGGPITFGVSPAQTHAPRSVQISGGGVTVGPTPPTISTDGSTIRLPQISIADDAAAGNRTVTMVMYDGATATCSGSGCLTVTDAPRVASASPQMLNRTGSTSVTVTGSNFVTGSGGAPTTKFRVAGFTLSNVTVTSSTSASFDATPVQTPSRAGSAKLVVSNPDGGTSGCQSCLFAEDFDVTGITPTTAADGPQGGDDVTFTVSAANLPAGATNLSLLLTPTQIVDGQSQIVVSGTVAADGKSWTGTQSFVNEAPVTYQPELVEPGPAGQPPAVGFARGLVSVTSGVPVIRSISPQRLGQGGSRVAVIKATNLTNGAQISFPGSHVRAGQIAGLQTNTSTGISTAEVSIGAGKKARVGLATVRVVDLAGQTSRTSDALRIDRAPSVKSAKPRIVGRGERLTVTLHGKGFRVGHGRSTRVRSPGLHWRVRRSASRPSRLVAVVRVGRSCRYGWHRLTLINPDGGIGHLRHGVRVVRSRRH